MISLHLLRFFHIRTSTEVQCFWKPFVSICASSDFFSSVSLESWKPFVDECHPRYPFFKQNKIRPIFIFIINIEPPLLFENLSLFIYCHIQCRVWLQTTNLLVLFEHIHKVLSDNWETDQTCWVVRFYLTCFVKTLQLCINDHMRPSKLPLQNAPCSTIELSRIAHSRDCWPCLAHRWSLQVAHLLWVWYWSLIHCSTEHTRPLRPLERVSVEVVQLQLW